MRIYSLGSLNVDHVYSVDHFVRPGETLASHDRKIFPGGKGLNQSVALARAGAQVRHGAMLGTDGTLLENTLKESCVDVSALEHCAGACGHAIIQVDHQGQNCILLYPGTNHMLTREYIQSFLADAQPGDLLLMQNETNALSYAFSLAKQKGMQIAFNPSPFDESILRLPLEAVDWWFCNEIEAAALLGQGSPQQICSRFARRYPGSHLILTLGSQGSCYTGGGKTLQQSIYPVQAVDTTAAGDTFTGYFLAAVARGEDVALALKLAAKASAIAVSRPGASVSIPMAWEVTV